MFLAMVHRKSVQERPESMPPDALHPVLHWLRRIFKLAAALVLIPPVLLAVLIYFSVEKAIGKYWG